MGIAFQPQTTHIMIYDFDHKSYFRLQDSMAYFTNILMMLLQMFAHATTAQLPCYVHTFSQFSSFNTLRLRQNGRHFADDIFKCIFLNENVWISLKISLKFVPKVWINNIPTLVQIVAWRRPGDKPLSEPILVILLMHICVTGPQWVKFWSNKKTFLTNLDCDGKSISKMSPCDNCWVGESVFAQGFFSRGEVDVSISSEV